MAADGSTRRVSVVHLVHRAAQRADELFASIAPGLSPRKFEVLRAVAHAEGASQTAIMAATGIDRSSTASLVAALVRAGLLRRRRTRRDNRTYAVRLTDKGHEVLEQTEPLAKQVDQMFLAPLKPKEGVDLVRSLEHLAREAGD